MVHKSVKESRKFAGDADIILEVFINIDPFAFTTSFSIAPASSSMIIFDVSVMLLYTFVALALSLLIFDRREIK